MGCGCKSSEVLVCCLIFFTSLLQTTLSCYTNLALPPRFGRTCEVPGNLTAGLMRRVSSSGCHSFEQMDTVNGTESYYNCMHGQLFNLDVCVCLGDHTTDRQTCLFKGNYTAERLTIADISRAPVERNSPFIRARCNNNTELYLGFGEEYRATWCVNYWTSRNTGGRRRRTKMSCPPDTLFAQGECECVDKNMVDEYSCNLIHNSTLS